VKNFYLVYNVDEGKIYGSFNTADEAIELAETLATENVEKEFCICSPLYGYKTRVVVTRPELVFPESN
jgi:hypothetical protein